MKKKNLIYLIIAAVLVLVTIFVVLYENGVLKSSEKIGPQSSALAIKDSSRVTKIFIADMFGSTVLLRRTPQGWMVNDSILATQEKVESLLSILMNLTVRQSVPEKAESNINMVLTTNSIKVEVYEKAPKFKIFGINISEKERKTKTLYMGPPTQDNVANFAYQEGMKESYIVHIPGFRGYVTPQFSPIPYEWITHRVFETKITRIESLAVEDLEHPEESFLVVKAGPRSFDMFDVNHQKILDYDTLKLIDMLSEYRNRNFEYIESSITQEEKDSIIRFNHHKIITLTDTEGNVTEMKLYKKEFDAESIIEGVDDQLPEMLNSKWDFNRFYATINGDLNTLYVMQFYHFDRQVQPLSYFLDKN